MAASCCEEYVFVTGKVPVHATPVTVTLVMVMGVGVRVDGGGTENVADTELSCVEVIVPMFAPPAVCIAANMLGISVVARPVAVTGAVLTPHTVIWIMLPSTKT